MPRYVTPRASYFNINGSPRAGSKLFFYETGTNTPRPVYANDSYTVPLSQPVIANSAGEFVGIWLPDYNYRVKFENANGVEVWTEDPLDNAIMDALVVLNSLQDVLTTDLTDNSAVEVLGYSERNDGGAALWIFTGLTDEEAAGTLDLVNGVAYDEVGNQFEYGDPEVNVVCFGGDVNSAISYAATNERGVLLPPGSYSADAEAIDIAFLSLSITGIGRPTLSGLSIINGDNLIMSDINLVSSFINDVGGAYINNSALRDVAFGAGCSNIMIDDCTLTDVDIIDNSPDYNPEPVDPSSFLISPSTTDSIDNVVIDGCIIDGPLSLGNVNGFVISDCVLKNANLSGFSASIYIGAYCIGGEISGMSVQSIAAYAPGSDYLIWITQGASNIDIKTNNFNFPFGPTAAESLMWSCIRVDYSCSNINIEKNKFNFGFILSTFTTYCGVFQTNSSGSFNDNNISFAGNAVMTPVLVQMLDYSNPTATIGSTYSGSGPDVEILRNTISCIEPGYQSYYIQANAQQAVSNSNPLPLGDITIKDNVLKNIGDGGLYSAIYCTADLADMNLKLSGNLFKYSTDALPVVSLDQAFSIVETNGGMVNVIDNESYVATFKIVTDGMGAVTATYVRGNQYFDMAVTLPSTTSINFNPTFWTDGYAAIKGFEFNGAAIASINLTASPAAWQSTYQMLNSGGAAINLSTTAVTFYVIIESYLNNMPV